jgi:hypothetical protein
MKVAPHDIRYRIIVPKTTHTPHGPVITPHVLHDDLPSREAGYAKQPTKGRSVVQGYVKNTRSIRPTPTTAQPQQINKRAASVPTTGTTN